MGGNAGNPTALRTGGGRRLAGRNTVAAAGRRRAGGRLADVLNAARANNARNARRRARVAGR